MHVGKSQWTSLSANISSLLSYYILLTQHRFSFKHLAKKTKPFSSFFLSFVFFFCPTLLGFQVVCFFPLLVMHSSLLASTLISFLLLVISLCGFCAVNQQGFFLFFFFQLFQSCLLLLTTVVSSLFSYSLVFLAFACVF